MLLNRLDPRTVVLADKAYAADRIRASIQNLPRTQLIERFFSMLKHFRRVATRHGKLTANFLATVQLAAIRLRLRIHESTT